MVNKVHTRPLFIFSLKCTLALSLSSPSCTCPLLFADRSYASKRGPSRLLKEQEQELSMLLDTRYFDYY
jgi:hypothetical protein